MKQYCTFYLILPIIRFYHTPPAELRVIPVFADRVEMKPLDVSVMF